MRSSLDILSISNSAVEVHEILKCPVRARVVFKILVTVFRFVHGATQVYLGSMFKRVEGHYRLRSSNEIRFIIPRTKTRVADRLITAVGMIYQMTLKLVQIKQV